MIASVLFSILLVIAVDMPVDKWRHRVSARLMRKKEESIEVKEAATATVP